MITVSLISFTLVHPEKPPSPPFTVRLHQDLPYANSTANISSSKLKAVFSVFVLTTEFVAGVIQTFTGVLETSDKSGSDFLIHGNSFSPFKMFVLVTSAVVGCIIIYYRQMSLCKVLSFFNEDRSQTSRKTCITPCRIMSKTQ